MYATSRVEASTARAKKLPFNRMASNDPAQDSSQGLVVRGFDARRALSRRQTDYQCQATASDALTSRAVPSGREGLSAGGRFLV